MIFCFGIATEMQACRFTVREIGFSSLEQDFYSLVRIDTHFVSPDDRWDNIRARLQESNIRLVVLNGDSDKAHPIVIQAIGADISFPANLLVSPNGRMLLLEAKQPYTLAEEVLDSPLRVRLRTDFPEVYSTVIWIESTDEEKNAVAASQIKQACDKITNLMPQMPKQVKKGPKSLKISLNNFSSEKVLLWALGIEEVPEEPVAFLLYGRGRMMGEQVLFNALKENRLFRLMTMIGADCECGLDRKWMLGHQIPLFWPADIRRQLVKETGFDVDNPMILAEMSFILAREPNPNASGSVTFAPEGFDLDQAFKNVPQVDYHKENNKLLWNKKLLIFVVSGIIVVFTGLFFFTGNSKSG